jgi:hypothetical protein
MTLRSLLVLAFSAALLGSGFAAAQTPSSAKVTITDLAPGPATLAPGQTQTVSFNVNVFAAGFQCTTADKFVVDLVLTNAAAAPPGVKATVDPANVTIAVPVGAYQDTSGLPAPLPVGAPFNASGAATLKITADPSTAGGDFKASVSAALKDGQPGQAQNGGGCVGTVPAAQDTKTHEVVISAGTSGGNNTGGGPIGGGPPGGNSTGGNTSAPPPEEPTKKSPGIEPLVIVGVVGALAVLRRRKD